MYHASDDPLLPAQGRAELKRARYRLTGVDGPVGSDEPGRFAGITSTRIFGRLTCRSGERASSTNRVFFATWEDAVAAGFRPCKLCRPEPEDTYEQDVDGRWQLVSPPPS